MIHQRVNSWVFLLLVAAFAISACNTVGKSTLPPAGTNSDVSSPAGSNVDGTTVTESGLSPQGTGYIIGASDLLEISVWGEQNLSRQLTVRSDGFISLPLAGDILAAGKNPSRLKKDIETILAKYIKDPRCAVIVVEPRSKRFYVQGQVVRPGQFTLDQSLSLAQVIPLAGGFTEWADTGSIVILRIDGDKKKRLKVDYDNILKGKIDDVMIQPGDTIIVP